MLMPAAILVLMVLAAITVDLSQVHRAKRDLISLADSLANDAAGIGVDRRAILDATQPYASAADLPWDRDVACGYVLQQVRNTPRPTGTVTLVACGRDATNTVFVDIRTDVASFFAKSIPGAADSTPLTARGRAELQ